MEFLSLTEYEDIAKKLLHASFPKIANYIINSDEYFGEVVQSVIIADWKFNGKGNIFGYRKQRVKWTIYSILSKKPDLSLNFNITDNLEMSETIPDRPQYDKVEEEDYVVFLRDKITNSNVLTEKEKICIKEYMTNNVEIGKIATSLDVHKETVKLNIRRGLSKLGLYSGYIERFEERKNSRRKSKNRTRADGF